ncbi:hypothetical protein CLOBY_09560 [Clostridium saccharobutylicum]|nr:hypothetical protein CLOSC_09140 [Clostridium saccharobutylicum]OAV41108.1 hypothetical protein M945_1469 [Clostridium saccharobutylicum DSM 13864]AQR99118.1 hypothetical protein CSACC_09210 [Clostridium saccharobutylicum]AQS08841.1 hypothetical protein CLOBY_09560 [Clostridium saccharobutylicum]AQS13106.1 hypothetical protein CLOSACC_09210 [Clostridium saccharobutylicum]
MKDLIEKFTLECRAIKVIERVENEISIDKNKE